MPHGRMPSRDRCSSVPRAISGTLRKTCSPTDSAPSARPYFTAFSGESDTGVIISWNTEGPRNVKENAKNAVVLPNAVSINPLNWKLDETYAPASMNRGSFMPNMKERRYEITDIGADAQVVLKRGVIVTNAQWDHPAAPEFFGPQSFHEDDCTFYYNNLKDNVAKRIAAYQSGLKQKTEPCLN